MAKVRFIKIHEDDNVLVALESLQEGERLKGTPDGEIAVITPIPLYHKMAVRDIAAGQPIVKYGTPIGYASVDIRKGEHVHVHNIDASAMMKK